MSRIVAGVLISIAVFVGVPGASTARKEAPSVNEAPAISAPIRLPQTIRVTTSGPVTYDTPEPIALPAAPAHTLVNIIRGAAMLYGVDEGTMLRVARCESTLNPAAVNHESGATGLFQWIASSWTANVRRGGFPYSLSDRTDPAASSMVAAYTISKQGLRDWEASRHCWAA